MPSDFATTNVLLGIMAAVSVLETLALLALLAGSYVVYRRLMETAVRIEEHQVAPMAARVNAILDDVKSVTSTAKGAASSADAGVRGGLAWLLRRFGAGTRAA